MARPLVLTNEPIMLHCGNRPHMKTLQNRLSDVVLRFLYSLEAFQSSSHNGNQSQHSGSQQYMKIQGETVLCTPQPRKANT